MTIEEPRDVVWYLDGYDKEDELLRTRRPISRDQIIRLRKVIIPDEGDPWMLYGYDVPLSAWPALDEILHCGPPDPTLDYQTGSYAAETTPIAERLFRDSLILEVTCVGT
ncbi:DUF7683 domain-containing protein [Streptomyces spongiicola]